MSARSISKEARRGEAEASASHAEDPRVVRSRAAMLDAARELFLREGYAGATMDEIADLAGLTKRTVYNHYADKDALFTDVVSDVVAMAEDFSRKLREQFAVEITEANLRATLQYQGRRLALAILSPRVVQLRRLLIGEARRFPDLAADYFARAPGQVLEALASGFERLDGEGLLRVPDAPRAAAQFAYLMVGEPLDRAVLVGEVPSSEEVVACAHDGVETFLARYGAGGESDGRGQRR